MTRHTPTRTFDERRLVLASASPRRRELLASAGFLPVVEPADVPELREAGELPDAYVRRLAAAKATRVAARRTARHDENPFVLAADTIVVVDGDVLEKPASTDEARAMLERLSAREHLVLTGVAVTDRRAEPPRPELACATTRVVFAPLQPETIERYVASGEPMDKAGAYGIQGLAGGFVERIEGSWSNVVGLPLCDTLALLRRVGALGAWPFLTQHEPR